LSVEGGPLIPRTPGQARTLTSTGRSAAPTLSDPARTGRPDPHATGGANTRTIREQVTAATILAERLTIASRVAALKANNKDSSHSGASENDSVTTPSASVANAAFPVAVLMVRLDIRSLPELSGKMIAIDDKYSVYDSSVRTAIVAAGAHEIQLSEGQTTAINRLVSGEVPAAVLALVSAKAAESFPEIAGFRIFHIPLSIGP
jgi:hypothetical protein